MNYQTDRRLATRWAAVLNVDVKEYLAELVSNVERELRRKDVWDHVVALADRLREKPILIGAEVERFFEDRGLAMASPPGVRI